MLAVAGEDVARGMEALREHWAQFLPDESDPDLALVDVSVDLDAEEARCPACGDAFGTAAARCPGCGLRLG